jgi:dnd system-associated protein 4
MPDMEGVRTDRVLMDDSVMDIYRDLRIDGNSQPEQTPFATYKDIFMLAACLGFRSGRRHTLLAGGGKHDIRTTIFSESDMALLKAIAIAETGDVEVLSRPGEIVQIAEEYAHSGIFEVKAYLLDERGRPLWNLVALVAESNRLKSPPSPYSDM